MSKELLFAVTEKDCDWQFFCAGGKGGQHQNKTASACRCKHRESGAEGISRDHREQRRNRVLAFKRMAESLKFQTWLRLESSRRMMSVEQKRHHELLLDIAVDNVVRLENLKIECRDDNGEWVEYKEDASTDID